MSEHDEQADRLEREADDMEHHSAQLGEEIADTREEWERKKADDRVPGAAGRPEEAEGDVPPEATEPPE